MVGQERVEVSPIQPLSSDAAVIDARSAIDQLVAEIQASGLPDYIVEDIVRDLLSARTALNPATLMAARHATIQRFSTTAMFWNIEAAGVIAQAMDMADIALDQEAQDRIRIRSQRITDENLREHLSAIVGRMNLSPELSEALIRHSEEVMRSPEGREDRGNWNSLSEQTRNEVATAEERSAAIVRRAAADNRIDSEQKADLSAVSELDLQRTRSGSVITEGAARGRGPSDTQIDAAIDERALHTQRYIRIILRDYSPEQISALRTLGSPAAGGVDARAILGRAFELGREPGRLDRLAALYERMQSMSDEQREQAWSRLSSRDKVDITAAHFALRSSVDTALYESAQLGRSIEQIRSIPAQNRTAEQARNLLVFESLSNPDVDSDVASARLADYMLSTDAYRNAPRNQAVIIARQTISGIRANPNLLGVEYGSSEWNEQVDRIARNASVTIARSATTTSIRLSEGAEAILRGDIEDSDRAALAMGRGASRMAQRVGVDENTAEGVGRVFTTGFRESGRVLIRESYNQQARELLAEGALNSMLTNAQVNNGNTVGVGTVGGAMHRNQITLEEVQEVLRRAGMSTDLSRLDTNRDGLTAEELQRGIAQAAQRAATNQAVDRHGRQLAARGMDLDGSRTISTAERQLMQRMDTNHDGNISSAEFREAARQAGVTLARYDHGQDGITTVDEIRQAMTAIQAAQARQSTP